MGGRIFGELSIDRPFEADWSSRVLGGTSHRGGKRSSRIVIDGGGVNRTPSEHVELARRLVDHAAALPQKLTFDLTGHVQQRSRSRHGLNQRTGRVASARARRRHRATKSTAGSGISVRCTDSTSFGPCRNPPELPVDGVDQRQVVHTDHAERGLDLKMSQYLDEKFTAREG